MKKVLIILYCVLLAGVLPAQQIAKNTPGKPAAGGDLRPSQQQAKVQQLITQILTQGHYRKLALDDSLSSAIFDRYLQSLDNNKVIFLASDIAAFEKYRTEIDDDLKQGELAPAYTIFTTQLWCSTKPRLRPGRYLATFALVACSSFTAQGFSKVSARIMASSIRCWAWLAVPTKSA